MKHNLWNLIAAIKNGYMAKKPVTTHVNKKICREVLDVLWKKGYILGYKKEVGDNSKLLVFLKLRGGVKTIRAVSKPGNRLYCSCEQLWEVYSANTLVIVSTNRGIKSLDECRKLGVGGEPLIIIS